MPWTKLFPTASKKAINLLSRMLVLHPKERLTVEQALVHPYLNKYHDPDDEPICVPAFNFDFEKEVGLLGSMYLLSTCHCFKECCCYLLGFQQETAKEKNLFKKSVMDVF